MDMFYALAEPRRRKIIELLAANGEMTATEICKKFEVTAQAISQHLRILLNAKLVLMKRNAQKHIYALNPATIGEVEEWAINMEKMWNKRLDRLDKLLDAEKSKNAKKVKSWKIPQKN